MTELSKTGMITEVTSRLRATREAYGAQIETMVAQQVLAELGGKEPSGQSVGAIKEGRLKNIDIFVQGLLEDYEEVIRQDPQLAEQVTTLLERVKANILHEVVETEQQYADLRLNLDQDPLAMAANFQEESVLREAISLLSYELLDDGQHKSLKLKFFSPDSVPTLINVGIKGLIQDYSPLRRPIMRQIVALAKYRANVFKRPTT